MLENEAVIVNVALKYAVDLTHCFKPYIQIQTPKCQNMNVNFIVKTMYSQKVQKLPHIILTAEFGKKKKTFLEGGKLFVIHKYFVMLGII